MALIAVSGHPGCRFDEVARITAQRLKFELLTQSQVRNLIEEEFGTYSLVVHDLECPLPDREGALRERVGGHS